MEDDSLPSEVLNLGNQPVAIFKALYTHEYMSVPTIVEKTAINEKSISPCMTQLRRTGWVEYKGSRGHRLWIRRKAWAEPQADLAKRGGKKKRQRGDVHFHLVQSAFHLNEALRQIGYVDDIQKAVAKLGARMDEHDTDNGDGDGGNAHDR